MIYGLPFFVGGLFIGTMFTILSSRMHALYFWNMLGSGVGGLLVLVLMFLVPPDFLIYPLVGIALLPALLCTVHWDSERDRFFVRALEASLCVLLSAASIFLVGRFGVIRVSDFKPESYARDFPDSSMLYHAYSPLGESRVYSSSYFHFAPGLSDNAGVSLPHMPRNAFLGLYVDGNGPVGIMRRLAADEEGYVDFLPMSAPYHVLPRPRVLLLRLGGGAGIQTALHNGAGSVWVVESNPDLLHMLRDVPFFQEYTGNVLLDPRVKLVKSEVRAFAASTRERFDLVEIGLIDSIGLSQAGGYSVEENYTYTVEAIRDYIRCLAPVRDSLHHGVGPSEPAAERPPAALDGRRGAAKRQDRRIPRTGSSRSTSCSPPPRCWSRTGTSRRAEVSKLRQYCHRMSFEVAYEPGRAGSTRGLPEDPGRVPRPVFTPAGGRTAEAAGARTPRGRIPR